MKSRGKLILFADADGASKFSDFQRLEQAVLKNSTNLEVKKKKKIFIILTLKMKFKER
jgi:hypothetical protein